MVERARVQYIMIDRSLLNPDVEKKTLGRHISKSFSSCKEAPFIYRQNFFAGSNELAMKFVLISSPIDI